MREGTEWRAVVERRAGAFVYAVVTTGIYCRPGCASRRPLRKNVRFFATPRAAELHGFRPCRRCRPDSEAPVPSINVKVGKLRAHLDRHPEVALTLEQMAELVGASPAHLQRRFKALLGSSPAEYQRVLRARALKRELRATRSATDAIYAAGYGSSSRVYESTRQLLGMTPQQYRNGGEGVHVCWMSRRTELGRMLVAASPRGICFARIGNSEAALRAALRRELPRARLDRARPTSEVGRYLQEIVRHLRGEQRELGLPLDVHGTAFDLAVWRALSAIPYGETRSYSQVARALGKPTAQRAVGRACARNPLCILIPCHRVVKQDGQLGDYRWGRQRKRALLAREAEHRQKPQSARASAKQ